MCKRTFEDVDLTDVGPRVFQGVDASDFNAPQREQIFMRSSSEMETFAWSDTEIAMSNVHWKVEGHFVAQCAARVTSLASVMLLKIRTGLIFETTPPG